MDFCGKKVFYKMMEKDLKPKGRINLYKPISNGNHMPKIILVFHNAKDGEYADIYTDGLVIFRLDVEASSGEVKTLKTKKKCANIPAALQFLKKEGFKIVEDLR